LKSLLTVAREPRRSYSSAAVFGTFPRAEAPAPHCSGPSAGARPPLAVAPALLRRVPHLQGFFPDREVFPQREAPPGAVPLALDGEAATAAVRGAPAPLRATEGLWRAPAFGRRRAPIGLVVSDAAPPMDAALRAGLCDAAARASREAAATAMANLRDARIGGAPGLPDPGPAGLGLPRGEAVLVIDPCETSAAPAARRMLDAARRSAGARPLLLAASPAAPAAARPVLAGERRVPRRLAPWTLLDLAAELHVLGDELGLLGLAAAGVRVRCHADSPWSGEAPEAVFAALLSATRWADPFRGRPWTAAEGLAQLADWRAAEAENRRIVSCTGVEWFKHRRLKDCLSSATGPPRVRMRGSDAIRDARRRGGAVAVWSSVMPPGLPARAREAGVPLVQVEDGFIRSAGLGALLAPAASLVLDGRGIHYDPSAPSDLEALLAETAFAPALLRRAARLREALLAGAVTKYNLPGAMAPLGLPPGRRAILVPGQVEDDAAMRRGGARLRTNLELLRAVRRENPDAVLLYKPHPDVEAGMRRGAVPPAEAARLADRVLSGVPIGPLYARVDEVHCLSSLSGFEALLRGRLVVTHGRPFYAGWGLTEDRDPPPRRGRRLSLNELVAGALILYPRHRDPATGLPCPPEVLVERLAGGVAAAPPRARRLPRKLAARIGAASRFLAEWWAER
jgi:capsular polysaccharide export protein